MSQRRSEPRIPIASLHNITFQLLWKDKEYELPVTNISTKGIGLIIEADVGIKIGDVLKGLVTISDMSYLITAEVRFCQNESLGCQILSAPPAFASCISDYFQSELLALNLKPENGRYESQGGEDLKYYEGQNNCYVLIVKEGNLLKRYKVSYFGNIFEGGHKKIFTAGQIVADREFDKFSDGGRVEMVKALNEMAPELKLSVIKFIEALEFVEEADKREIQEKVKKVREKAEP